MSNGALRQRIEEAKAASGTSMKALTVLAEQHDPYRLDTSAGHLLGAWVAEQFEHVGKPRIHLRGLHYSIVARGGVSKPNGSIYVNTELDWVWLQEKAAKAARWLGYVPFTAITDERNAAPVIHRAVDWPAPVPQVQVSSAMVMPDLDLDDLLPTVAGGNWYGRQPYSLVIVGEKSSLGDVVLPIARDFEADVYLPTGEISDTLIYQIAKDAADDGRPLRLFYLSDFDPAGYEMPANVGRKLQALRDLLFPDLDFECRAVALTFDQVRSLGLPSTPLKDTEQRSDQWRNAWGVEQTEIDALATLQPHVLTKILHNALAPFHDRTLRSRVENARFAWWREAQAVVDARLDRDEFDWRAQHVVGRLATIRDELDDLGEWVQSSVGKAVLQPVSIPTAKVDETTHGKPLVSSEWPWTEQTQALIAWKSYSRDLVNGAA